MPYPFEEIMPRWRYDELMLAYAKGYEPLTDAELFCGWHFCPNSDFLLVGPGMPEFNDCLCEGVDNRA